MLPPKRAGSVGQQRLVRLYRELDAAGRRSLLDYAEFLSARDQESDADSETSRATVSEPVAIARPNSETVIAAIRRLSETFPMLDKDEILHEASALMTAHVMQGRSAVEVIDDLELVFRRHYERVKSGAE